MRAGSLCTGYGGLDLAVDAVLDTTTEWVCEFDAHASKVCDARFPGVPNLHDLTTVNWRALAALKPVDVVTAGYPCQPFSHAGRRQGVNDDRHLWPHIAGALDVLRPRLVVLENVAGHLSLGFDRVLGDLAELGFDAEWCVVRASDVGACHQRKRLFILAADAGGAGTGRDGGAVPRPAQEGRRPGAHVHAAGDAGQDVADTDDGADDRERPRAAPRRGDQEPAHPDDLRHERSRSARGRRARSTDSRVDAPDTERSGRHGRSPDQGRRPESRTTPAGGGEVAWGDYATAIRRHELAVGRGAPAPTDERGRLSPRFVEWMMMLPDGWVCDVPDLSRSQQLKILGNGVVPPQAAYAIRGLLERLQAWEQAA